MKCFEDVALKKEAVVCSDKNILKQLDDDIEFNKKNEDSD